MNWAIHKRILSREEIGLINAEEYVGALSDFTGEIGRLGVAAASKRDNETVHSILLACVSVATAMMRLDCGNLISKLNNLLCNYKY